MLRKRVDVDVALVRAAVSGNAQAVEDVVRALTPMLFGVARRMMQSPTDADDATQEALVRVVTRLSQYQGESRFTTWAFRVAVRSFLDFREAHYRHATLALEQFQSDLADGLDMSAAERPEDGLMLEAIKLGCGAALLGVLDGDHRITYILSEIVDFPGEEVAQILDVPHTTVRKRLSRARERVRDALTSSCGVVNPACDCRCHRRLDRARALSRVPEVIGPGRVHLPQLREYVAKLDEVQRAAAFYRADIVEPREGMSERILSMLRAAEPI